MAKKNAITKSNVVKDSMLERRTLKREATRALRRAGKRLLEDAPKRCTRGWWV